MRASTSWLLAAALLGAAPAGALADEAPPAADVQRALDRIDSQLPYLVPKRSARPGEVELGRRLFFDPRLSASGAMSCATCHQPGQSFTDGLPRAVGRAGKVLPRNTPTLIGGHYRRFFFWDGRAGSVEEAALSAIQNPDEMARDLPGLERVLSDIPAYQEDFARVYGRGGVSSRRVSQALGSFIAQLSRFDSPYDRFHDRGEPLPAAALRGLVLFAGKAGCVRCHGSPDFTDEQFWDVGLRRGGPPDPGRYNVTRIESDRATFRAPSLRNAARTPPYMHDGSLATLADVVEYFDRGGDAPPVGSPLRPLGLTPGEKRDLVAFLESLSSSVPPEAPPLLPLAAAAPAPARGEPPRQPVQVARPQDAPPRWSSLLPRLPEAGSERCLRGLSVDALVRRVASERWRERDTFFVTQALQPAFEDYYLALAIADGEVERCAPLAAFPSEPTYPAQPASLDARCRERYYEKRLAQALSGRLADGERVCEDSIAHQPFMGYSDAPEVCRVLLAHPNEPEKTCAALVPRYLDPPQVRSCARGLRVYRGLGVDCADLDHLETHIGARCRLHDMYRRALDAGSDAPCRGSADCRVLFGEGRAVAAETQRSLLERACALPDGAAGPLRAASDARSR